MRIWIVGSGGQLGCTLLEHCRAQGIEAIATSRQEADICSLDQLENKAAEISPTHIINCAAYTHVDGAEKDPEGAFAVNCEGAANLAKVAKEFEAKLIHISTDYVFDGYGKQPYVESDRCSPLNVYGKSKWEGEKKVLEILPHACVIRTSWVFGPKGKNFISSLLGKFAEVEELQVVTDQVGKPTYCPDLAKAVIHLLNSEGIVHFTNEQSGSRYEIANTLLDLANKRGMPLKCRKITPVLSAEFPTPAMRPSYSALDTSKYVSITSLKPRSWVEAANEFLSDAFNI